MQNGKGDEWSFIWNSDKYTYKRFYKLTYSNVHVPRPFVWIWKTKCVMKINVFAWLLFRDRLNTRDMLDRRHCAKENDDLTYELCRNNIRETREHLFFFCPFSQLCWQHLGITWNPDLEFFSDGGFGSHSVQSERSLLLGTFGSKGMGKFFAMSFPRSVLGGLYSKPMFFCICAE